MHMYVFARTTLKKNYKEAQFFSRLDPIQYQKYNTECRHPAQLQWFEI